MFTGIVEARAPITRLDHRKGGLSLALEFGATGHELAPGQSVALDGVCLTVTRLEGSAAWFDAIPETLDRTTLGSRKTGDELNFERALRVTDRLDGHIVLGHIDGTGRLTGVGREGEQVRLEIACDTALTDLMVPKGSIALDGVSLTLASLGPGQFTVCIIPHTLEVTTLGKRQKGDGVNIECDVLGKWVKRLVDPYLPQKGITLAEIARFGYKE